MALFVGAGFAVACSDDVPESGTDSQMPHVAAADCRPGVLHIRTVGSAPVTGKEKADYVACSLSLTHDSVPYNFAGTGKIRGRGNTTWEWFPKKPYRIKLDDKASLMGMSPDKDWVLLANFRDPTDLMNAFAFELARRSCVPFAGTNRFVETYLNDEYLGLYQLTEQIEVGPGRVDIHEEQGILLSMDQDDGPRLSPQATDNFTSEVYNIPVCIKCPDEPDKQTVRTVRASFAALEGLIKAGNFNALSGLADLKSFADFLLIQELTGNVDLRRPASLYIHKDKGGKWTMGPLWDFDSAYDFDWAEMRTGHRYFISDENLMLGWKPAELTGITENTWFFTHLFKMPQFVQLYKQRWSVIRGHWRTAWGVTQCLAEGMMPALLTDAAYWQIGLDPQTEISRMQTWLTRRVSLLDTVIDRL